MAMELDESTDGGTSFDSTLAVRVLQDHQSCIPLSKVLCRDDTLLLLTPLIQPLSEPTEATEDPFETLGQRLSQKVKVRHVPYTKSQGVTGIHVAFAKRAKAVICIITKLTVEDEVSQPHLAALMAYTCRPNPFIIVACCSVSRGDLQLCDFPTVVTAPGYSPDTLKTISSILFEEDSSRQQDADRMESDMPADLSWRVDAWNRERDAEATHDLWMASMPHGFRLDRPTLDSILIRPGFAHHLSARESTRGTLIGFCAVYITYGDSGGSNSICSIAAIIVREEFRKRGVGTQLHNEAIARYRQPQGLKRIQLGSTFPRLLYGPPVDPFQRKWFENRGWTINGSGQGKGRIVADWILRMTDLPTAELASAGLSFRRCEFTDSQHVFTMTAKESDRKLQFGWYDQYVRTLDSAHMENIILAYEGATLAAAALTYTPNDGSISATDLPWPSTLGNDIGGITCICFNDDDPEIVNRRETIMIRLLHVCARSLSERGMVGIYADGLKPNDHCLETLGFTKWAEYYEVWRQA
ncbi:hypothetical protein NLU13_1875 [Sarocladium strictum]|uniref:N-acetyltransferase domain-containing protein n=1 Tax=Sarocladium strictum TaxID=5046 RepID=A0AA39GRS0_SARSR|nr:hypothetical protein NLU13_1875 [Sarocladium strictum]